MAFVSTNLAAQAKAKAASVTVSGRDLPGVVDSIASAVTSYVLGSGQVQGTNVVLGPGSGTFTGRISGVTPLGMSASMRTAAAPAGLAGRDLNKLLDSISFGVVQALLAAMAQGTVIGGGPGSGQGRVIALVPKALEFQIRAALSGRTLVGKNTPDLVTAMSFGICNHIMQVGIVTTVCVGVAAGPPVGPITIPAAPGIGKLV